MARRRRTPTTTPTATIAVPTLTAAEVFGLAALAQVDPRSVKRALRGEHVSRDAGTRIRRALAASGYVLPESVK